jgi:hypothetical protein
MNSALTINEINKLFPNEWVLIGDPVMDQSSLQVLAGVPVYHSQDKKEVCYIGRDKAESFSHITLIYKGLVRPLRKITGIFNRLPK